MELLDINSFSILEPYLNKAEINTLFARSVIEKKVSGKVFVDSISNPRTFHVVHPYGMSLLLGDTHNEKFNKEFYDYALNINRVRTKPEWLQAYPSGWDEVIAELFGEKMIRSSEINLNGKTGFIELCTRINFKFIKSKYESKCRRIVPDDCAIVRTDARIFEEMRGSVIPSLFWNNAGDFLNKGAGFTLLCDNKIAATAYSAFVYDGKLELGIETVADFRGRGFAELVCSALIDYCIENIYEPVWACRLENAASFALAQKLGFDVCREIPYYRLCG
ncbi:MAG: GNAT family N-acetyltransferase [Spirochaetes bacterium]|nr:GNAT family N-acetyltransferase [Spirochaetota bacterium]